MEEEIELPKGIWNEVAKYKEIKSFSDNTKYELKDEFKYFTPSIEDIRVGYEYEVNMFSDGWEKEIFGNSPSWTQWYEKEGFENALSSHRIRTLYLNKQQIENEGWKILNDWSKIGNTIEFEYIQYPSWRMYFMSKVYNNCHFFFSNTGEFKNLPDMEGCLLSINEFRTFIKLTGLKEAKNSIYF